MLSVSQINDKLVKPFAVVDIAKPCETVGEKSRELEMIVVGKYSTCPGQCRFANTGR